MAQVQIAVQLKSLRLPFQQSLATVSGLGVRAVELDARGELKPGELSQTGLRQFRKKLDDLQLRVVAVGFATRRGYDVELDLDRRVQATKEAMQFAYALGASLVVNQVGRVPDDPQSPAFHQLVQVLTDLGAYGQHSGAMLCAKTGSESGAALAGLLDAVPDGTIGVAFDPGNLMVNGFSPAEALSELGPRVLYVLAKDAVRDLAQGRGLEVPLGRGAVDFPSLLGSLEELAYRGYYTVERTGGENPVYEVSQAVQYLRNL